MRWFVRSDLDGFFGLALDNLVQLLLIDALCRFVLSAPRTDLLAERKTGKLTAALNAIRHGQSLSESMYVPARGAVSS